MRGKLGRGFRAARLYLVNLTSRSRRGSTSSKLSDLTTYGRFINLDHRGDRRLATEGQLKIMDLSFVSRFPGFLDANGALGCAKAHFSALSSALMEGKEYTLIAEDDIALVGDTSGLWSAIEEFVQNDLLDVLCVGNRSSGMRVPVGKHLLIAFDIQTTSFYVAKRKSLPALVDSAARSILLLQAGASPREAAVDVIWKEKQASELVFCIPREKIVIQRPSHSDVVGRYKDYGD